MNREQKFFLVVAALLAVFLFIVLLIRQRDRQAVPVPITPAATTTARTRTPAPQSPTPFLPGLTGTVSPEETPVPGATDETMAASPTPREPLEFYVAVDGSKEGDGSIDAPWPLQYALNHPDAIQPGDTIWLRGGVYDDKFILRLEGEEGRPITVRAMPGERVILTNEDLVLDISTSSYVNLWGLEITASENSRDPVNRPESAYGVRINQGKSSHHINFINMIVHDMPAQGFGWWRANRDSEIYGSLIYFNGVNQFDHGIYVMNKDGEKRITDNFIFDNASHGIHAYGNAEQELDNIRIEGNTVFNNGSIGYNTRKNAYGLYQRNILLGGDMIAHNPVIIGNYTYYPSSEGDALNLGYRAGSSNAIVENNYFAGGEIKLAGENREVKMTQNTILGLSLASLQGIAQNSNNWIFFNPDIVNLFVRPNKYEPGRANITVYNWSKQESVFLKAEDLAGVQIKPGDQYEIHNVQDYFEDVITGTYDGVGINIPMMGHSVAQPLGLNYKPMSTFPEFGGFVLIVKGGG